MVSKIKPTLTSTSGDNVLTYFDKTHRYYLNDKSIPSITGIGNAYPKDQKLIDWQIEQGKKQAAAHMNKASKIGTIVHDYVYLVRSGLTDSLKELKQTVDAHKSKTSIINGIKAAQEWNKWSENKMEKAEVICCSPVLRVAGKFDELAFKRDGSRGVVDYKTSGGIYITQFQQAAGYRRLILEWFKLPTDWLEIVRFDKETGEFHVATIDRRGLWYDGELKIEDPLMLEDMDQQFIRNVGTSVYMKKYENFWKEVR